MTGQSDIAVLTIDMQNDVLERLVPTGREVVPAIQRTLRAARDAGIPVVHSIRLHRADASDVEKFRLTAFAERPFLVRGTRGAELIPELEARPQEDQVGKSRFSGFFQSSLLMILTRMGVKRLVVVGVQTPNCVRGTVNDALAYDFDVILLRDAINAATPEVHEANLFDMANWGAQIQTVDQFLASISSGQ